MLRFLKTLLYIGNVVIITFLSLVKIVRLNFAETDRKRDDLWPFMTPSV